MHYFFTCQSFFSHILGCISKKECFEHPYMYRHKHTYFTDLLSQHSRSPTACFLFCSPSSHARGWAVERSCGCSSHTLDRSVALGKGGVTWYMKMATLSSPHTLALLISPLPREQLSRLSRWHIWTSRRLKPVKYSCLVCEPVNHPAHPAWAVKVTVSFDGHTSVAI